MKKLLALLLTLMLAVSVALADYPDTCSLTIPYEDSPTGSLTLSWYDPPCDAISSSEVFIEGLYVEEKWEEAYRINLLLAEAGDTLSMLRLGDHCLSGLGTPQDEAAAFQWYERAHAAGNRSAGQRIALMYLNGWGVEADAQYAAGLLAEKSGISAYHMGCLYLLGCGNLEPDMEQAMYWFDLTVAYELRMAQSDSPLAADYQAMYERKLEAFLAMQTLPDVLTTRPSPIAWYGGQVAVTDAMDMGDFWRDGDGGTADPIEAARWYEMTIAMDNDSHAYTYQSAHHALGDLCLDGSLGAIDVDSAIRHYGHAASYSNIAAMFRSGVTGPDGTVYLTPDETLADAFTAVDEYREGTRAHFILLGDLFRTGSSPDGYAIITPDPYLAATFYFQGYNDPHCAAQLTAMYKDGLITDPMLLYLIARDIPWSEYDVSELILLLADDLIHERVEPWLPNNAANIYWNGVSTPVTLGVDLLEKALEKGKLPDPQAAYDLLALVPSNE